MFLWFQQLVLLVSRLKFHRGDCCILILLLVWLVSIISYMVRSSFFDICSSICMHRVELETLFCSYLVNYSLFKITILLLVITTRQDHLRQIQQKHEKYETRNLILSFKKELHIWYILWPWWCPKSEYVHLYVWIQRYSQRLILYLCIVYAILTIYPFETYCTMPYFEAHIACENREKKSRIKWKFSRCSRRDC